MTAPCPTFGFHVFMEPRPNLNGAEYSVLSTAWTAFLEGRGLYCEGRGDVSRMAYEVMAEGTQTTDADRTATRAWLEARLDLVGWRVSDLEDLKASR